ncbi:SLC13 family permease [Sulfobacillus thermosulfidooxidans]|uniref:SLC13 family permease n=1 Tax=Sulfobacillus thermosulfidooxidans TaxID=28034 RepID=UPI000ACCC289|nr:SLC13 family permease [Sulfobacillus thermosulfidooxidans]
MQSLIVLGIFLLAMALLASNRVRIDLIGLIVLLSLGLTRSLPLSILFSGFSSEAVILIAGMLALGEGLVASGVTDWLARFLQRIGGSGEKRLSTVLMITAAFPSAFISDVGLVGMFIPVVKTLHQRIQVPVQKLLMPLAVAATLGGLLTMVGSAGNIVGNQALKTAGYAPISIFGITPLGLALLLVGIGFMVTLGRFLIPQRSETPLIDNADSLREYMSEVKVLADSPLIGKTLDTIKVFTEKGLTVTRIVRNGRVMPAHSQSRLQADDILLVLGDVDRLLNSDDQKWGMVLAADPPADSQEPSEVVVAELLLGHRAPWVGRTVIQLHLRHRYGITVLGLYRDGELVYQRLTDIRLRVGDILLVQGSPENLAALQNLHGIISLNEPIQRVPTRRYGLWLAPTILLGSLLLAALNIIDIKLAIVLGIVLMAITGILQISDAYRAIEWRIVVFVAGMIPLGTALIRTGITQKMVSALIMVNHMLGNHPTWMIAMLFMIAAILTQVLSNIATVLVLAPVAAQLARPLHVLPDPFVMAVMVAVSASPLTPLANKVDLLIMGPGGFKYGDFLRLGIPLTVLFAAVATWLIPIFFPF